MRQGGVAKVDSISDRTDYKNVSLAFRALNFNPASVETIWKTVAAVLHLVMSSIPSCCRMISRYFT